MILYQHSFKTEVFVSPCLIIVNISFFSDQAEARRQKVKEARKRREERIAIKRQEMLKAFAKEDEASSKK